MNASSQISKVKKETQSDKMEKLEVFVTNILFGIMIGLTIFGTGYMGLMLQEHLIEFQKTRPDYKVPKLGDFYITLLSIPILAVKFFIKIAFKNFH
jgi:hypothetical protein